MVYHLGPSPYTIAPFETDIGVAAKNMGEGRNKAWAREERNRNNLVAAQYEQVPQSLLCGPPLTAYTDTSTENKLNAIRLTQRLEGHSQVLNAGKSAPWAVEWKIWNDVGCWSSESSCTAAELAMSSISGHHIDFQ